MIYKTKNVLEYYFGFSMLGQIENSLAERREINNNVVYFIDSFFKGSDLLEKLSIHTNDFVYFVDSSIEPSTDGVDNFCKDVKQRMKKLPAAVIGMGGGCTLDIAKAISNLLTNNGLAEDYQGWDLLKKPGIYKIGIPTISGTGAESSRTCVMMNKKKNLKLGMNSEYSIYDCLILDPELSKTVPREQYFYTGLDSYIHCIESLNGQYRHPIADSYSEQVIKLSREIFFSNDDMMNDVNREKLMVASYIGGCAIANSFVGVIHPFSAGLSVALGIHHCLANCLVLNVMEEFYPKETEEFHTFLDLNKISLPKKITKDLNDETFDQLYLSTIIHEKPLMNALGENFKKVLSKDKVSEIFKRI